MIDYIPSHEHRVIIDDNFDYLMFADNTSIKEESYILDGVLKSYKSAWIYVLYYRPYVFYTLDGPDTPIGKSKYKTVIDCQNYKSITSEMYSYDINDKLVNSASYFPDKKLSYKNFMQIHEDSIGSIQADIICGFK